MSVAGVVLAAGRSSRMGTDKALLTYRGHTFLNHLIYLALPRVKEVVVVLGHNADAIAATVPNSPRIRSVVNREYDRGMLSSLQKGLAAAAGVADLILWMLVDHPAVRGRSLDALIAAAESSGAPLVIPRYNGKRGHPVVLSGAIAEKLLRLDPARSPQDVVRSHYSEACFLDLHDSGVRRDVDRPPDYRELVGQPNR